MTSGQTYGQKDGFSNFFIPSKILKTDKFLNLIISAARPCVFCVHMTRTTLLDRKYLQKDDADCQYTPQSESVGVYHIFFCKFGTQKKCL